MIYVVVESSPRRIVYGADTMVMGKDNTDCHTLDVVCLVLHCPLTKQKKLFKPSHVINASQAIYSALCLSRLFPLLQQQNVLNKT